MAEIFDEGRDERWPALPLPYWSDTRDTLHMWLQVVGKWKVALAPYENQLWHTALHLTARGLTTGPIPYGDGVFEARFDFVDHNLELLASDGGRKVIPLYPRSVADFYREAIGCLAAMGIVVHIQTKPQEVPDPIPFEEDEVHASYDAAAVNRFWRILTSSAIVLRRHKSHFTGKASPVHFFWGALDLTTTRHNGEPAPIPPGRDYIYRAAENEANWAAGFWPGSGPIDFPAFYSYMIPEPSQISTARVQPELTMWDPKMHELILPYDVVRTADDPEATLMSFLESSYSVAADLSHWDRKRLEVPPASARVASAR